MDIVRDRRRGRKDKVARMIVFSRWKQSYIKSAMVRFIVFADRPYASWDKDGCVFGGKTIFKNGMPTLWQRFLMPSYAMMTMKKKR